MNGFEQHKRRAPEHLRCYVITVSDTRTEKTDESGRHILKEIESHNYTLKGYHIVKDNPGEIERAVVSAVKGNVDAVIINGGTGISKRDTTTEVISKIVEKEIKGFGEIFRFLSYKEIGASAMLSRAVAGVKQNTVIFSIPGSLHAVKLALNKLILPELGHIVGEIKKERA